MKQSSSIIVEDIYSTILVPRSSKSSINRLLTPSDTTSRTLQIAAYQVYAYPKTPFRLKLSNLSPVRKIVPYIDSSIKGRGSKVLSVLGKGYRPYFSCFVAICADFSGLVFSIGKALELGNPHLQLCSFHSTVHLLVLPRF